MGDPLGVAVTEGLGDTCGGVALGVTGVEGLGETGGGAVGVTVTDGLGIGVVLGDGLGVGEPPMTTTGVGVTVGVGVLGAFGATPPDRRMVMVQFAVCPVSVLVTDRSSTAVPVNVGMASLR